jgi:hypothetical protein
LHLFRSCSEADCSDVLFATTDGTLWQRLVGDRGWTDERYADWLGTLWVSLFVTPKASARAAPP